MDDLVTVKSGDVATHTAIIAQSGAGKSFFLGTLIEEILVKTKARCIIFDPNADFRNVHAVRDRAAWDNIHYDVGTGLGWLPSTTFAEFREQWDKLSISIYFGPEESRSTKKQVIHSGPRDNEFKVWWPDIDAGILTDGLDVFAQSEVHHCHRFVKAIGLLMLKYSKSYPGGADELNLVDSAQEYFRFSKSSESTLKKAIQRDLFPDRRIWEEGRIWDKGIDNILQMAIRASRYVTESTERFYFGQAKALDDQGILRKSPVVEGDPPTLRVLDLPSFPNNDVRRLAISAVLADVWRSAREEWSKTMRNTLIDSHIPDARTPTFVVVDEAHNLMPAHPQGSAESALRDQFRTIVAEGRKYGLFLILVTQRPDKVDPVILSECENKAVMLLGTESVANQTVHLLGLEGFEADVKRCLEFTKGRVMLAGKWSRKAKECLVAARRTVEGGSDLRVDHWGIPR